MELHKKYLEELERKRQILQQRRNGNFTNLAQPGQQSAVPLGQNVVGGGDYEQQQMQMAIAQSLKDKDKPKYGAGVMPGFLDPNANAPDFLDEEDAPKEIGKGVSVVPP